MSEIMDLLAGLMWCVLLMLGVLVLVYALMVAGPTALVAIGAALLVSAIVNRLGL